jgi:hypothetical protein
MMFLDVLDALCYRDLCTNCASLCPSESLSRLEASSLLLAVGTELITSWLEADFIMMEIQGRGSIVVRLLV